MMKDFVKKRVENLDENAKGRLFSLVKSIAQIKISN